MKRKRKKPKHCATDNCPSPPVKGEKYCSACRKRIKAELAASGFLTRKPYTGYRASDARENTHETKFGRE